MPVGGAEPRFDPTHRQWSLSNGGMEMKVAKQRLELVAEDDRAYNWDGRTALDHPEAAAEWFRSVGLASSPQEQIAAIYVDTRNRPLGWAILFVGTINRAACEPRPIMQTGLLLNAAGFFLAHNHPSGDPSPSAEDLAFTRRLADAGNLLGIRLIDHIIVGDDRWMSLKQRGGW
jgi:DNA repair protein RadC